MLIVFAASDGRVNRKPEKVIRGGCLENENFFFSFLFRVVVIKQKMVGVFFFLT